jgi:hypothetical protein
MERCDVYLLGTALPSFWVACVGEMRLTLGLSGWTTNDWTRGSALDLLAPPVQAARDVIDRVARLVHSRGKATFAEIDAQCAGNSAEAAAALDHLAHSGQLISDLADRSFRWRQVMPMALGEAEMGPENEELRLSREIVARRRVKIESRREATAGSMLYTGTVDGKPVELFVDSDGRIRRGKCVCSHHYKAGIRMGPCRHLLAMRRVALAGDENLANSAAWYERLRGWATV